MKAATIKKVNNIWTVSFASKKGISSKSVSDKILIEWLNKNIPNANDDNDIFIQDDTGLQEVIYNEIKFSDFKQINGPSNNEKTPAYQTVKNQVLNKFARSPYNFIPLNEKVLLEGEQIGFDKLESDRYTGYLTVNVTNLTPLFLRQISDSEDNFGYGGKFGIPGSSFRGMIRSVCEILGFGNFGRIDDHKLYFRQMFGNDQLAKDYKADLGLHYDSISKLTKSKYLKSGWLKIVDGKSKIFPCTYTLQATKNYEEFSFIKNSETFTFSTGHMNGKKNMYVFTYSKNKEGLPVDENYIKDYGKDSNRSENIDKFFKKIKEQHPELGIPVFFKEINNTVVHFGHTLNYRLPYKEPISSKIPNLLKNGEFDIIQMLFGDVFYKGKKEQKIIASRLAFGDLLSENAIVNKDTSYLLKILSSPKPTTFQHYLEQGENAEKATKNWNSDTKIRGNKIYWHRETQMNLIDDNAQFDNLLIKYRKDNTADLTWNEPWTKEKDEYNFKQGGELKTGSHTLRIKPIQEGAIFSGKIWFTNLSKLELGLLLTALEPSFETSGNQKIAHKLGLGKPLGLGSIEVNVDSIHLMNLEDKKYFKFYNQSLTEVKKEDFIDHFKKELASKLGIKEDIWSNDRLKELKTMLTWNNEQVGTDEWLRKTRYMEITRDGQTGKNGNEFSERPVLPKPSEVVEMLKGKFQDKSK